MPRHPFALLLVLTLVISTFACADRAPAAAPTLTPAADEELSRIAAVVSKALEAASPPEGARLLAVARRSDGVITINLSEELLVETSDEKLSEIARQVLAAASGTRTETGAQDNFVILVNGALLDSYLPSVKPEA